MDITGVAAPCGVAKISMSGLGAQTNIEYITICSPGTNISNMESSSNLAAAAVAGRANPRPRMPAVAWILAPVTP